MLKNYFTIAFRHLTKNSVYSFINITGLSVGIGCSILILLWVADELAFNKFHKNYDRLYQVYMNQEFVNGISTEQSVPYPLKDAIINKASQVKHVVMTNWGEGSLLTVGENRFNKMGLAVTEDFLKMFSFDLLKGNPETALDDPTSIVLTESTAKALFGDQDPINQLVKIDNNREQKVTGIIKDVPEQSTFQFDVLLPFSFFEATQSWIPQIKDDWNSNTFQMYVELQPNSTLADANESIKNLVKENKKEARSEELFLHPMDQWRLYTNFENGKVAGGMIDYVQLFSAIAIFVLVIACINFMNLATARSESRAREVGIRKSVGSRRKELIFQFLGESILITFIAFLIAVVMVEVLLPSYNTLVDKKLFIDYSNGWLWVSAFALVLITGFVAGSYPAFYLSAFQPVKVLKGKVQVGKGASTPRQVLVTLQFGFSILLIIGTVVIYQQIQHVKSRDMGYDRENLMLIWTTSDIERNFETMRQELVQTGKVKSVAKSNSPITAIFATNRVEWEGMPQGPPVEFTTIATEYDYTETMGIKMIDGRDFSRDFKADSTSAVINRAALDLMGLKNPLGSKMKMHGTELTIIGVMENVVMGSPYRPIDPLVMIFDPAWSSTIAVRLEATNDLPTAVAKVETIFKKIGPSYPFEYRFADVAFDKKFSTISLISRLATLFAFLAIFITCLGLFGLAAFTAEQRTKEIGIRKVMGATVSNLVLLITKDFSRLVILSFVISAPLAWWAMNNFLERYPYRIAIAWWILPLAGLIALLLTLLIVSSQALRAARNNPSQSLRSE
jgi:putative ABC transport system permease protein